MRTTGWSKRDRVPFRLPERKLSSTTCPSGSAQGGHGEGRASGGGRPPLGDGLLPGVEAHRLRAVGVVVAEEAPLPAAEAVEGHGDGDGYVHADHADLDPVDEL